MKLFSIIRMAVAVVLALTAWARAAEPSPGFTPAFRSGMVLADWRGSAETNVVLHGWQPAGRTVFVKIGFNDEIKTESDGAEWRLTVKGLNDAHLTWSAGPCVIEATSKERNWPFPWKRISSARLTNVLIGDVWVVAVPDAEWSQAREIKSSNGFARFFVGDPAATNGSGWFPAGPSLASPPLPKIAAHFAEELFQRRQAPVGLYLVRRTALAVEADILQRWTEDGQKTRHDDAADAALAARRPAGQASRAERAAFVARSREAKKRGAVIEGVVPSVEGTNFSLRQCGAPPGSLPLFHQLHVHGFLW